MNKKIILILVLVVAVLLVLWFVNPSRDEGGDEQVVLKKTLELSKDYVALRYQTDNLLMNARDYSDYNVWNRELTEIIAGWKMMEEESAVLQEMAENMSVEKQAWNPINQASAYTREELSAVFDKAPAGKKIATLAKHLGVDAKRAYALLTQEQNQIQADTWNEEGDTFKKLETTAVVVKDGAKVIGFVGTIAMTGGTAALAAGGTLAKTAVVVAGADLVLEVADDTAKIAIGDNNKISKIVGSARVVTEPVAAILMISNLPKNLTKGIDKLGAVTFGADQLNATIQDGKVIGIKLPVPTKGEVIEKIDVSVIDEEEVGQWISEEAGVTGESTVKEAEGILNLGENKKSTEELKREEPQSGSVPPAEEVKTASGGLEGTAGLVGIWEGIMKFTPNKEDGEQQKNYVLELNDDGTVGGTSGGAYSGWRVEGGALRLIIAMDGAEGYDEFSMSGNNLVYVKRAGPNSEGEWQEDYAGSDFFGGKFMEINLQKL